MEYFGESHTVHTVTDALVHFRCTNAGCGHEQSAVVRGIGQGVAENAFLVEGREA